MAMLAKKAKASVGIKELKDKASEIIQSVVQTQTPVVVTKNNKEIAKIIPITPQPGTEVDLADLGLRFKRKESDLGKLDLISISAQSEDLVKILLHDRDQSPW